MVRLVLLRLLESYFHHRWLYLLPVILMSTVGGFYVLQLPSTYISRGTIYVQDNTLLSSLTSLKNDGFSWITPSQAMVNELNELFATDAFLRAVVQNTDLEVKINRGPKATSETVDEARKSIWAYSLGKNLVLIGASHEMPRVALQLVQSTIETYIQWKTNLSLSDSTTAQDFFAELIETYRAEVEPARKELTAYLVANPRPVRGDRSEEEGMEIARLTAKLDRAVERLNRAENQEESARLALVQTESDVRQAYSVVDSPERPLTSERSKKDIALTLAMFLAAGMVITATGILGGALLDTTFRFPVDIKHGLHLPTLALVAEATVNVVQRPVSYPSTASDVHHDTDVETTKPHETSGNDTSLRNGSRKRHHVFG